MVFDITQYPIIRIDITFFAKHSGSISGVSSYLMNGHYKYIVNSKETSFAPNKIESLKI